MRLCITYIMLITLLLCGTSPVLADDSTEAEARRLINALGCKGCHQLEKDGGSLAPPLDQIGTRMSRLQIRQHLSAHAQEEQKGFMPSYNTTSQAELELISDFLYNLQ